MSQEKTVAERAKEIIKAILSEGHLPPGHPDFEYSAILRQDISSPEIAAELHEYGGASLAIHDPEKIAEELITLLEKRIKDFRLVLADKETDETLEVWHLGDEMLEESKTNLVFAALVRFINNLVLKFDEMVREQLEESVFLTIESHGLVFVEGMRLEEGFEETDVTGLRNSVEKFVKDTSEPRKVRLMDTLSALTWKERSKALNAEYTELLEVWQDAKKVYLRNQHDKSWPEYVKSKYDLLPNDLILRLSGRLNDLPEETQARLSEKGGDSSASDIALEHAARRCGAKPYEFTTRYLYLKMAESVKNGEDQNFTKQGKISELLNKRLLHQKGRDPVK